MDFPSIQEPLGMFYNAIHSLLYSNALYNSILFNDNGSTDRNLYITNKWQNIQQDNQYKRTHFKGVGYTDNSRINEEMDV